MELLLLPHFLQFLLVQRCPLENELSGSVRQIAFNHFKCIDIEQPHVLAVDSVEMWRRMIPEKQLYNDAVESRDFWHMFPICFLP
jgi:hypothetical protein